MSNILPPPAKQPRCFENFEKIARNKLIEKSKHVENMLTIWDKTQKSDQRPQERGSKISSRLFGNYVSVWGILTIFAIGLAVLIMIRFKRKY